MSVKRILRDFVSECKRAYGVEAEALERVTDLGLHTELDEEVLLDLTVFALAWLFTEPCRELRESHLEPWGVTVTAYFLRIAAK